MKKLLVICPNYWDKTLLPSYARNFEVIFCGEEIDLFRPGFDLLAFAQSLTDQFKSQDLAGIVSSDDYPGCLIAAIVANNLQLPGCNPKTIVELQHKYHARTLQKKLLPAITPEFHYQPINPTPLHHYDYPLFMKPCKGVFSYLTQTVTTENELTTFIKTHQEALKRYIQPFEQVCRKYRPDLLSSTGFCMEQVMTGQQVTVEGFVSSGSVNILGIVDSVMYPGTNAFQRFEYPSKLNSATQQSLLDATNTLMKNCDYDNQFFNIEFFCDNENIWLLELNTRMSSVFADLFYKVNGINSYELLIQLATGCKPIVNKHQGAFSVAAAFVLREFADKCLIHQPDTKDIDLLRQEVPDLVIKQDIVTGEKLSSVIQSTGSYKYVTLHLGAASWKKLDEKFDDVMKRLHFEFSE